MLRLGLSVSSPSEAQASKPAQDRNAKTVAVMTAPKVVPPEVNVDRSRVGAPPLSVTPPDPMTEPPTTTAASTSMARMPRPSMISSVRAVSRVSRELRIVTPSAATTATTIHGPLLWTPSAFRNACANTPVAAWVQVRKNKYVPRSAKPPKNPARGPMVAPASAYTEPAWLKCWVRRQKP